MMRGSADAINVNLLKDDLILLFIIYFSISIVNKYYKYNHQGIAWILIYYI